jgi:hypothetical protein
MASEIACPRCNQRLRVLPDTAVRWLTCPRCLASIKNPGEIGDVYALAAEPDAPAEARPGPRNCRSCGRPAEAGWRFCPYCEQPLRRRRQAVTRERSEPDEDAWWDARGVDGGLIGLGVLLMVGIVLFVSQNGLRLRRINTPGEFLCVGAPLLIAGVGGVLALAAGAGNPLARRVTRGVGCATMAAGIAGLLILSAFIGLLSICSVR